MRVRIYPAHPARPTDSCRRSYPACPTRLARPVRLIRPRWTWPEPVGPQLAAKQ
jgi:hypothetical protein